MDEVDDQRRVILGIGNPGEEYRGTRHNIGWMAVDALHAALGGGAWTRRFSGLACEVGDRGRRLLLLKPQTYVNLSGESAQAALAFYRLPVERLLVVVDDLHLDLGTLRLRPDGSAGGHNGLKDIAQRIGQGYARLRIGVGRMPACFDQVAYVLGRFPPEQAADAALAAAKAADACRQWAQEGAGVACRVNGPLRPPAPPPAG